MYLMAKNWLGRTRKISVWMWALLCLVLLTIFPLPGKRLCWFAEKASSGLKA